jgi:hypothetical protein
MLYFTVLVRLFYTAFHLCSHGGKRVMPVGPWRILYCLIHVSYFYFHNSKKINSQNYHLIRNNIFEILL